MEFRSDGLSWAARRQRFAGVSMGFGVILGLGAGAITLQGRSVVPLLGQIIYSDRLPQSLGNTLFLISVLLGMAVCGLGYRRLHPYNPNLSEAEQLAAPRHNFIGHLIVTVAVTVGLVIGLILALNLIERLTGGLSIGFPAALLISGIYGGILAGAVALWVVTLRRNQVFGLGALVLVSGVVMAGLSAADPKWWENSLSAIGHDPNSGYLFNLSLVVGGLVVLSVALDLLAALRVLVERDMFAQRHYTIMHYSLLGICLLLTAVGLFPTTINFLSDLVHNVAASAMVLVILFLMFVITFAIPIYPTAFRGISILLGVISIGLFALHFGPRRITFTELEVLFLPAAGLWMFILHHYTSRYIMAQDIPNYP